MDGDSVLNKKEKPAKRQHFPVRLQCERGTSHPDCHSCLSSCHQTEPSDSGPEQTPSLKLLLVSCLVTNVDHLVKVVSLLKFSHVSAFHCCRGRGGEQR